MFKILKKKLLIFNTDGRILKEIYFTEKYGSFNWNVSALSGGVYFYQIQAEGLDKQEMKKLIIIK